MNKESLSYALAEAERFIRIAKTVKWETRAFDTDDGPFSYTEINHPAAAATNLAWMDLTRALARMRNPVVTDAASRTMAAYEEGATS